MKSLWHHNYTKMTSLYYNLARKFEIFPTFLIYFDWNLIGIIFSILVLRLFRKEMFLFFKKRNKYCFEWTSYIKFIPMEF
jgi:hypothetical protein